MSKPPTIEIHPNSIDKAPLVKVQGSLLLMVVAVESFKLNGSIHPNSNDKEA